MKDIDFVFTVSQQEVVAEYYGKDVSELEVWEISELLDRMVDEKVSIE